MRRLGRFHFDVKGVRRKGICASCTSNAFEFSPTGGFSSIELCHLPGLSLSSTGPVGVQRNVYACIVRLSLAPRLKLRCFLFLAWVFVSGDFFPEWCVCLKVVLMRFTGGMGVLDLVWIMLPSVGKTCNCFLLQLRAILPRPCLDQGILSKTYDFPVGVEATFHD